LTSFFIILLSIYHSFPITQKFNDFLKKLKVLAILNQKFNKQTNIFLFISFSGFYIQWTKRYKYKRRSEQSKEKRRRPRREKLEVKEEANRLRRTLLSVTPRVSKALEETYPRRLDDLPSPGCRF